MDELFDALVRLCQEHGITTEATYEHLHSAVDSIVTDPDPTGSGVSETSTADPDDGRACELTYKIVVNVHPEDGEPDGGLPAGAPVEFYKLPDEVGETLKDLGNEYLHEVNGVEPIAIRFLS